MVGRQRRERCTVVRTNKEDWPVVHQVVRSRLNRSLPQYLSKDRTQGLALLEHRNLVRQLVLRKRKRC